MSIPQERYVSITSAVGGASAVDRRYLGARILSISQFAGYGEAKEFTSAAAVLAVFGADSYEYQYALKYFGYISEDVFSPKMLSISSAVTDATNSYIIGMNRIATIAQVTALGSSSTLKVSVDGADVSLTVTLTGVSSFAQLITAIGTAIAASSADDKIEASLVSPNLVKIEGIDGVVELPSDESAALNQVLGLTSTAGAIVSAAHAQMTLAELLNADTNQNDNFGWYVYGSASVSDTIAGTLADFVDAGNVKFAASIPVTAATQTAVLAAVSGKNGVWVQLQGDEGQHEFMPTAISATTVYENVNATKNYMFRQFTDFTPPVTTETAADSLDALRVNYLGRTQKAGKTIDFLQRGMMQGDITDASVYVNEMWLKDAIITSVLNLLIARVRVPASNIGVSLFLSVLTPVMNEALSNGVFTPGKPLTSTQKVYIDGITGRDGSWFDVYNNGYVLSVKVESFTGPSNTTEYKISYTLIYSKGDSIRKVEGRDIMI